LTVATNISPTPAEGKRFNRPRIPWTAMTYRFLPPVNLEEEKNMKIRLLLSNVENLRQLPVLSAQFITAPTGIPNEMRNFPPADPPRPRNEKFHF